MVEEADQREQPHAVGAAALAIGRHLVAVHAQPQGDVFDILDGDLALSRKPGEQLLRDQRSGGILLSHVAVGDHVPHVPCRRAERRAAVVSHGQRGLLAQDVRVAGRVGHVASGQRGPRHVRRLRGRTLDQDGRDKLQLGGANPHLDGRVVSRLQRLARDLVHHSVGALARRGAVRHVAAAARGRRLADAGGTVVAHPRVVHLRPRIRLLRYEHIPRRQLPRRQRKPAPAFLEGNEERELVGVAVDDRGSVPE